MFLGSKFAIYFSIIAPTVTKPKHYNMPVYKDMNLKFLRDR